MRDQALLTCVLLAVVAALPPPPPRFVVEPPPFVYVADKAVTVVPCAAEQPFESRWLTEEGELAGLVPVVPTVACPYNRSLVIVGSAYRKSQCGVKLKDDNKWLASSRTVFCALYSASGALLLLSRPVRLLRVPDVARPTVRAVSNQIFDAGAIHLRCQVLHDRYHLQFAWLVDGSPLRTTALGKSLLLLLLLLSPILSHWAY